MNFKLDSNWLKKLSKIEYAFQPIVNIHNGKCYGYEALLRKHMEAGFDSIEDVFNQAYQHKLLHQVDLFLRAKAIDKFSRITNNRFLKLFFNVDNRVLISRDYKRGSTKKILEEYGLPQDCLSFEISEKYKFTNPIEVSQVLDLYRHQGFTISLDDFGTGFSGLQMLYYTEPDFIKIDRFFIQGIENDCRKKIFVTNIVNTTHLLGSTVIAEGVETEAEYHVCRDIGCDLVQGYFIQRPQTDIRQLKSHYKEVQAINHKERRNRSNQDQWLLDTKIEYIEPVSNRMQIFEIFQKFKSRNIHNFIPIVNGCNETIGIIREKSLKAYAYSLYGRELLKNPTFSKDINKFVSRFPIADIRSPVEKILEIYSNNENIEGIIIVDDMKYMGFLSASSLLKILNEKNLAAARDQNPLSRLPGNSLIYEYVSQALENLQTRYILAYFDFDNFKPFNDTYGFRNGDRAILLFSDLLKNCAAKTGGFAGHIGGDDFFLGFRNRELPDATRDIKKLCHKFHNDIESFYDNNAIDNGYIVAKDRKGNMQQYSIMTISSVLLELPACREQIHSTETVSKMMAALKKRSKKSASKLCIGNICDTCSGEDRPLPAAEPTGSPSAGSNLYPSRNGYQPQMAVRAS